MINFFITHDIEIIIWLSKNVSIKHSFLLQITILIRGIYFVLIPYQIIKKKGYRERYQEVNNHDPMICRSCGHEMELWKIWHPKYGVIYDEEKNLKSGKYDPVPIYAEKVKAELRNQTPQLKLFPVGA